MPVNRVITFVLLLTGFNLVFSQIDAVTMKNGDVLIGEVKSLNKGVLVLETDYSDSDFNIDYDEVQGLNLTNTFVIDLTSGKHLVGSIASLSDGNFLIQTKTGERIQVSPKKIVNINSIDDNFFSRFSGNLDLGYTITKAQNNRQFTFSGKINYKSDLWVIDTQYNILDSNQDNAASIKREEFSLTSKRFLYNQWYAYANYSYLLSTEQGIASRQNPNFGSGKFLIVSNKLFLVCALGVSYNIEQYFDQSFDKESTELLGLVQFEMFNFKDFDLSTELTFFPSLSEKKRFRTDYNFTLKYDLPLDFYVKGTLNLNYDNQPAVKGNDLDYVFSTGFGWEL